MKKIKKFKNFFIVEKIDNIKDIEMGLDLTKLRTDEFVLKKTIEYIKENKNDNK